MLFLLLAFAVQAVPGPARAHSGGLHSVKGGGLMSNGDFLRIEAYGGAPSPFFPAAGDATFFPVGGPETQVVITCLRQTGYTPEGEHEIVAGGIAVGTALWYTFAIRDDAAGDAVAVSTGAPPLGCPSLFLPGFKTLTSGGYTITSLV
jgi:hypothetical protein